MRTKADKGEGVSVKADVSTYTCRHLILRSEHRWLTAARIQQQGRSDKT